MATTKLWAVNNNLKRVQDYALDKEKTKIDLLSVIQYAQNGDKTEHQYYSIGINCDPHNAYDDFEEVKNTYGKTDGVLAYHGYLSFRPGEVTPDEALQIGRTFAEEMWGDRYQVLVSVHLNTQCLHCHLVVNSVSFKDGLKLRDNEKNWYYFKHRADEICRRYGKSVVEEKDEKLPTRRDKYVKEILDYALTCCNSIPELTAFLKKRGHQYQFDENLKYWTITPKGWTKPYRIKHLEKVFANADYSKEAIYAQLAKEKTPKPVQVKLKQNRHVNSFPTRYEHTVHSPSCTKVLSDTFRFFTDMLNLFSNQYYMPLSRMRLYGGYSNFSSSKTYKNNIFRPVYVPRNYAEEAKVRELNERISFLANNNINTMGDLRKTEAKEKEELADINTRLELLEARSQYENVSTEQENLKKKKNILLRHKKIITFYLSEEKEYGHNTECKSDTGNS